jgi:hypothetical protein
VDRLARRVQLTAEGEVQHCAGAAGHLRVSLQSARATIFPIYWECPQGSLSLVILSMDQAGLVRATDRRSRGRSAAPPSARSNRATIPG